MPAKKQAAKAMNPRGDLKAKVIKAILDDGEPWKTVLEWDGVNYGKAWLWVEREKVERGEIPELNPTATNVAKAREQGESWGTIMVRANISQAKARKLFEEATNVHSRGTRTGKGGRFMFDEEAYYEPDREHGFHYPVEVKGRPEIPEADRKRSEAAVKRGIAKGQAAKRGAAKKGAARTTKATAKAS